MIRALMQFFIRYSVATYVVILAFFLFGLIGVNSLSSSFFPLVPSEIININIVYPGASPGEIEEGVVLKIEDNLRGLIGIDRVSSVSSENSARITIEIEKSADIDVVLADVKNAVDRVPNFPGGMEPPIVAKRENIQEAISFSLSGKSSVDLRELKLEARKIEDELREIKGISQVSLRGFPNEEIEIALQEDRMRAFQLSFREVANAISSSNILTTGGKIKTADEELLIRANAKHYYAAELENLVIRGSTSGHLIRLKDIAVLREKWEENPDRVYYNGQPAIDFGVSATNNEDLIANAEACVAYIEKYNAENPSFGLYVTRDASITLIQRTELLSKNGLIGIFLVVLFLSFFLRPSLAFWVAFGLPISFLGMFIILPHVGVTINVLSLFGMIIVIGILVDDGIVISENIYHHYEKGKSPIRAAIDGTMEVIPAVLSAILTTIIAFSTFYFLDGRVGNFFSEVSTVVILTLAISLIEALLILPSHLSHSNALKKGGSRFKFNEWGDRFMNFMKEKLYAPSFAYVLRHPYVGFSILIALFMITIGAMQGGILKSTFFPAIASDRVNINLVMPQGTNEKITHEIISKIEADVWQVNEEWREKQTGGKDIVVNTVGQIGPGTANGSVQVNLLPGEERDFTAHEIAAAIREKVGFIPGVEQLNFGSNTNFGGLPVSISLLGHDLRELKTAKQKLKSEMMQHPKLKDVSDNDPAGPKEVEIQLRDVAYQMGFTLQSVMSQVRSGFFGLQAQRFQRGRDEIRVYVRYERDGRNSLDDLDQMELVAPMGQRVRFGDIADYQIRRGDITINHLDGKREILVQADMISSKESAIEILDELKEGPVAEILREYPSVSAVYEGQNREAEKMQRSASKALPVILFLIYMVIAFTFRSYSQPLLLLVMVPFSLIGVAWGHYIHNFPINILSMLGIIALIGIIVNDGLVLISKYNGYIKQGQSFFEALYNAGLSRFRAIFLTTITTVAGLGPLIFETSRQAQFLIPMAISIAYGIAIATFLTLYLLPLLLLMVNNLKYWAYWLYHDKKRPRVEFERAYKEWKNDQNTKYE